MEHKFSKSRNIDEGAIRLDCQEILKSEIFQYIELITHKDGGTEKKCKLTKDKSRMDEVEMYNSCIMWS